MSKSIKSKLKTARKLYQESDYQGSLSLLDEVLSEEESNYHALVLKAANCDQLEMEDESADCFWKAIRLDKSNVLAWQGLMQMASKNTERYYSTLVVACTVLIEFYSRSEMCEKLVQCQSLLVELLVRYRLELPLGMSNLRHVCESVLKVDANNPYALEALIRLKIEAFLFSAFPYLISPNLAALQIGTEDPLVFCRELVHSDTTEQLDALNTHIETHMHDTNEPNLTASVQNTVRLGRLACSVAAWILSKPDAQIATTTASETVVPNQCDSVDAPWSNVVQQVEQLSLNGYQGICNWRHLDLMDFHAMGLLVLATFKLHAFHRCDSIAELVLSYLDAHRDEMRLEARELSELATVPLSQLTDFLQPRPSPTPFRLYPSRLGWSGTIDDSLTEWIVAFRLANAAASEQPSLTGYASDNLVPRFCSTGKDSFYWSDVVHTLWLECCLTDHQIDTALKVLLPLDTHTESITLETILSVCALQPNRRSKLCCLWLGVERIAEGYHPTDESMIELIDLIFELVESDNELKTAREHFLLGRLISRLASLPGIPAKESRLSQPVEMERYVAGINSDQTYYANHFYLGRICRRVGQLKDALEALTQAKQLCPNSPECTYELALALCQNQEIQKAFDCYATLEQKQFTKNMWLNYGLIALRLRNTLKGVPALQKVIIMEPENALYWELLGEAYLLRKSYETAVKTLTKSIQLDPIRPLAHIFCGQAYRGLGETVFAIRHLEQGLEYARGTGMEPGAKTAALSSRLLALKELAEINLLLAQTNLRQGLSGQALDQLRSVLRYLGEAFGCFNSNRSVPVWAFHFAASALSLISPIHDPDLRIPVPRRLIAILKTQSIPESSDWVKENDSDCVLICPCVCFRLADIYFACALKRWTILKPRRHLESDAVPSGSPALEGGTLLVTIGLHCLSHARYLKQGYSKLCTCSIKDTDGRMDALFNVAESVLKRACRELNEAAELDQQFLDSCEAEEDVAAVSKINQLESSADKIVQHRLVANSALRSKAWHGLAELVSLRRTNSDVVFDYCLCQALMVRPQNSAAGTSLALRLLHQGRQKLASALLAHFQASDPENPLVWLASAHLNALLSAAGANVTRAKSDASTNSHGVQLVLQDLLQAACLGANVQVASYLIQHLFPLILEAIHAHDKTTGLRPDARSFLRLAIEVSSEAQNRALAFEPKSSLLWHNRGVLLQLAGLSIPATFCLQRAIEFSQPIEPDSPPTFRAHIQLLYAQYFLATYLSGSPDWTVADQLVPITHEFNPTLCTSLAEALAKGIIFLHHPNRGNEYELAHRCLVDEVARLAKQGFPAAITALTACPEAGTWISLLCHFLQSNSSLNPIVECLQKSPCPWLCPPQLAVRMSALLASTPKQSENQGRLYSLLISWERAYEVSGVRGDSETQEVGGNGHHSLADFQRLNSEERALWAEYNATLSARMGNGFHSGLAHLAGFVAQYPCDPLRWTAMGRWLLDDYIRNESGSAGQQRSGLKVDRAGRFSMVFQCVRNALELSNFTPCSLFLADLLTRSTQLWFSSASNATSDETNDWFLLRCLRRAAAFYPHVPGIREQLIQCTDRLVPSIVACQ